MCWIVESYLKTLDLFIATSLLLDLTKGAKGVETNVWLTIEDQDGKEHTGTLFVN